MFILTVVEAPVNKLEYLSAILFHGFLSSLQSGFIDPNQCCSDRQYRYDNIHLSTLLLCLDEKEGCQMKRKKVYTFVYQELWQYVFESAPFHLIFNVSAIAWFETVED